MKILHRNINQSIWIHGNYSNYRTMPLSIWREFRNFLLNRHGYSYWNNFCYSTFIPLGY